MGPYRLREVANCFHLKLLMACGYPPQGAASYVRSEGLEEHRAWFESIHRHMGVQTTPYVKLSMDPWYGPLTSLCYMFMQPRSWCAWLPWDKRGLMKRNLRWISWQFYFWLIPILGPPVASFYPFFGEGSPTKIDYRKRKGTLIRTSQIWRT